MRRALTTALVIAALSGCVTDAPDPARLASATTLEQALHESSRAYDVPRDLLAAIAWAETRFGPPSPEDEHATEGDHAHAPPEVGPLHLRHGDGFDTLARATALVPVEPSRFGTNVGLGVAGAAAVLASLGAETGADPDRLETWAPAVARYSGLSDRASQVAYADQVFAMLRAGASARAYTGETVTLAPHPALPDASSQLGVGQVAQFSADYGPARWVPANSANYTSGRGGASIQFVVIHTMQGSYAGSISWFQNRAAEASAHYNIRSSDGEITQMVSNGDTAWQAGNWYYNQHSIGIEHEGYVSDPGRWYTEAMYVSSARLVRSLCDRYGIPIDRQHIIGHYQVPASGSGAPCATNATTCGGAGHHTDPGNGGTAWNWTHFLDLVRGGGTVTPPTPNYAATLVGVSCPATARSGERPVAYVEYRNTGTATWDITNTRLGTSVPRDHAGLFYDSINWVGRNRPSGVDHGTAPGAVGRFSFVLGIPTVTSEQTVTEHYALVQEGVTWFGPADDAVTCTVRVSPSTPPPPVDSGTPAADVPPPPEDTGSATEDTGSELEDATTAEDSAAPEDTGSPATDTGPIARQDAGIRPIPDTGSTLDEPSTDPAGCSCHAGTSATPRAGVLSLALASLALASRRRRAQR